MSSQVPPAANPQIAAALFAAHVEQVVGGEQAAAHGWTFTQLDALHVAVALTAKGQSTRRDVYYVKLGGEYYNLYPPTTSFVCPPSGGREPWIPAPPGSRWLPAVAAMDWFAIHTGYSFPNGVAGAPDNVQRQLVCCSMTFEYYISSHTPTSGQQWRPGRHTLGATLNRIQDALDSSSYQGPAGALDP